MLRRRPHSLSGLWLWITISRDLRRFTPFPCFCKFSFEVREFEAASTSTMRNVGHIKLFLLK